MISVQFSYAGVVVNPGRFVNFWCPLTSKSQVVLTPTTFGFLDTLTPSSSLILIVIWEAAEEEELAPNVNVIVFDSGHGVI